MNPVVSSAIMGRANPLAGVGNVICWVNHRDVPAGSMAAWNSRLTPYGFGSSTPDERPQSTYDGILFDGIDDRVVLTTTGVEFPGSRHIFIKMLCVDVRTTYVVTLRKNGLPYVQIVGNNNEIYDGAIILNDLSEFANSVQTGPSTAFFPGNTLIIHGEVTSAGLKLWSNYTEQVENITPINLDPINQVNIGFLNSEPGRELSGYPNHYYKELIVVGGDMTEPQIQRVRNHMLQNN